MGIAAYNRASAVIAKRIALERPIQHNAFAIMDRINALPKHPGDYRTQLLDIKRTPFHDHVIIEFDSHRKVWWLMDPVRMHDGFSYWYKSLEDAIQSWDIYLTGYDEITNQWTASVVQGA